MSKNILLPSLLLFLMSISQIQNSSAQNCRITAHATPGTICSGENVNLSASGTCDYLLYETFNDASPDTGWSNVSNAMYNNPCGPGPDSLHIWFNGWDRELITEDLNLSSGNCVIRWWMRYGRIAGAGNCNYPNSNEGVLLEYSKDQGNTWNIFPGPNQQPVGNTNTTPPFSTAIPGSGYYWQPDGQHNTSEIYFWNEYEVQVPSAAISSYTRIRLTQNSSGPGYDSWGVDNFSIQCSNAGSVNNVSWSHGPNTLNPAPVALTNNGNTPLDTCFVVTISDSTDSASDTVCVTVNPAPSSDFSVSDTDMCVHDTLILNYTGNASNMAVFSWDMNGTTFNGEGPHNIQMTQSGLKNISLTVTDTLCTSQPTTETVEVHENPSVSFYPTVSSGCTDIAVGFVNQSVPSNSSFLWKFGDGQNSNQKDPLHSYDSSGTYDVSLFVTTQYGCTNALVDLPIQILQSPEAILDTHLISSNTIKYTDISESGNPSLHITQRDWDFSSSASPQFSQDSIVDVTYPFGGTFVAQLAVENSNGCPDTTRIYTTITDVRLENLQNKIQIYPNPSSGNINLEVPNNLIDGTSISLINIEGKVIRTFKVNKEITNLELNSIKSGSYLFVIQNKDFVISRIITLR